jgi:phenylacetic acid degradation operon negative regulatory protein
MLTDSQNPPAQRLIVTLLADYQNVASAVPSALIVDLLADLGVSSDAARTALSRLVKQGLIDRSRTGRSTSYRLSESGRRDVDETHDLILSFGRERIWDGDWTVIAYSVTEHNDRQMRHQLRARLRALGFAPVYDGMWVAPHTAIDSVKRATYEVGVADVTFFRGPVELSDAAIQRLFQAWEIDELDADYESFISHFAPLGERLALGMVSPAEALVARADLMSAWRLFPRRDPELPDEILGRQWPRTQARRLFLDCLAGLTSAAELRFRMILNNYSDLR